MDTQPNTPDGDLKEDGDVRDAGNLRNVKNQAVVSPDDYPKGGDGKPEAVPGKEKEKE